MRFAQTIILAIATGLLALTGSCAIKSDATLAGSVNGYVERAISRDYFGVWMLSSERFRRSNGNNLASYEAHLTSFDYYPAKIEVKSMKRFGAAATVLVEVRYVESNGASAGSSVEAWSFVYESEAWFFDGYRTVSESPP